MAKIVNNIVMSTQPFDESAFHEEFKKPFIEFLFNKARETVETFGEDRPWIIDALKDEKILLVDFEPFVRRVAAAFQNKVTEAYFP